MDNKRIQRVLELIQKYTYEEADIAYLDKIEEDMLKVISLDKNNIKNIEIFAKFLFGRKKYEEAIKQYNRVLTIKEDNIRIYYGLYKCYVKLNDLKNAYISLSKYINGRNKSEITNGMEIILSSFDIIFNSIYTKIENIDSFLMNRIKDNELKEKYKELVENFNKQNYSKCIILAEQCDAICRRKKILIEFDTFKTLLRCVKESSIDHFYVTLEEAKQQKDYMRMIEIINQLPKLFLKNDKLVYNSLYILIRNGYINEVEEIIKSLNINKDNKIIIDALKQSIITQREYQNLTEVQRENYKKAIKLGHKFYKDYDVETAYDVYEYGQYTTNCNIFLYYIGKMFFKVENYKEAEKYLNKYVQVGSEKLAKAYLYLATIYKKRRNNKKALYYSKIVEKLNKIYGTTYEMYYIQDKNDPEEDSLKMKLQGQRYMYKGYFDEIEQDGVKVKKIEIKD